MVYVAQFQDSCFSLICAAGIGSRAGGGMPKQYQAINGRPMLLHTIQAFVQNPLIARVLLVLSPEDDYFDELVLPELKEQGWLAHILVQRIGGKTRAESVCNGLAFLDSLRVDWEKMQGQPMPDWVMVHDAARPCVSDEAITRLGNRVLQEQQLYQAQNKDWLCLGGILALPVIDTVKLSDNQQSIKKTVNREHLWLAQTPQMFTIAQLYNALSEALLTDATAKNITDDASAMEWAGFDPLLILGEKSNIKVTYSEDFTLAAYYLKCQEIDVK